MKPANLVHVAGVCISCGIVAYYLNQPRPAPQVLPVLAASGIDLPPIPGLDPDDKNRIWSTALADEKSGRKADALGCFERFVALYPTDANAGQARARIAELRKAAARPAAVKLPAALRD